MADTLTKTIADFSTTLVNKVAVGDTTATLTSATDSDGVALPTGTYGFTIDRNNSSKEYFQCTLTGTALTAIRTVARGTGASTSGFARSHRKGAEVIISDFVAIKRIQDVLETGYASATTPSTDYMLATKKYVDDASIAGGTNATTTTQGFVELATQAEVDAGTATGGTGASLVATPATTRSKLINDYAVDSVGTDSYAITISPAITAYTAGQRFTFKAGTANTAACTLNVSGLGAKTIKKNVSDDLETGDILANQIVEVEYDGTNMQLLSAKKVNKYTAPGTLGNVMRSDGTDWISTALVSTSGVSSKDMTDASTTQTIAHGLGRTPTKVTIQGNYNTTTFTSISNGYYTSSGNTNIVWSAIDGTSGSTLLSTSTSYAIYLTDSDSGATRQTGVISVDATNITITWTKTSTPSGTALFIWQAE